MGKRMSNRIRRVDKGQKQENETEDGTVASRVRSLQSRPREDLKESRQSNS